MQWGFERSFFEIRSSFVSRNGSAKEKLPGTKPAVAPGGVPLSLW